MTASPSARRERVVPYQTGDGRVGHLVNVRGPRDPHRQPVLLVHGAGVRGDFFRPPLPSSIVDALVDDGYDVWLENWRASIDYPPNAWTLDQAALHDHPFAVRRVIADTGRSQVDAIVQCAGSTSFFMAAIAGLLPNVRVIVSNAVSLHPVVPRLSAIKLRLGLPILRRFTDYLNAQWGLSAPTPVARFIDRLVRLTHHECRNAVCRHTSFMYGAGFPSLWSHHQLSPETHDWIERQFGFCPISFFEQMRRSIAAGRMVAVEAGTALPPDVLARPPETDARIVFLAGEANKVFLPISQVRSFEYFDRLSPKRHRLHLLPAYGHADVFIGREAPRDVFPLVLAALADHG